MRIVEREGEIYTYIILTLKFNFYPIDIPVYEKT